jgi:hypothetical protein
MTEEHLDIQSSSTIGYIILQGPLPLPLPITSGVGEDSKIAST